MMALAQGAGGERFDPLGQMPAGLVRFAGSQELEAVRAELMEQGLLVALPEATGTHRGQLGQAIEDAIERVLSARGAGGPGIHSSDDPLGTLGEQIYRARRVGANGLAVVIGDLTDALRTSSALDPADGEALRSLADATRDRPLFLILDQRNLAICVYGAPIPLGELLGQAPHASAVYPISRGPVQAAPAPNVFLRTRAAAPPLDHMPSVAPPLGNTPAAAPAPGDTAARSKIAGEPQMRWLADPTWRTWTQELGAARGSVPLTTLERLFRENYVPLEGAFHAGLDDSAARAALLNFRNAFVKAYSEAFLTLSASNRRPRMVLDAPELGNRLARQHGARSTSLILVDAMRFDVAQRVGRIVAATLAARASRFEELLLWSALPTTTQRQLETIGRGVEALRTPPEAEQEPEPARQRTANYLRRLRLGSRELHKLDLIEYRLRAARGNVRGALPQIAEEVAEIVALHAQSLTPRTLFLVFGDHGFTIDSQGFARQGGASPEEVIVGAFALLIGDAPQRSATPSPGGD